MKIPSSLYWLGVFNSALLEMVNPYLWEQVNTTDMTIDEVIPIVQSIIDEYWDTEGCGIGESCLQPDDLRVLRLNATGNIQELADGVWQTPTGDYAIPAVGSRGEATAHDRKCAAAANAANVLAQVYEAATDALNADLSDIEVLAAMVAAVTALIGAWVGLAMAALVGIMYMLFKVFVQIARYMIMDLWNAEFTHLLECCLYACATDTGDVVTFDFDCIAEQQAELVDLTNIDALNQLRLFGQVQFMLNVIGVDGLNHAGTTTAITTYDCDDCGDWTCVFDFTTGEHGWIEPTGYESNIAYVAGVGFQSTAGGGITGVRRVFGSPTNIISVGLEWSPAMTGNLRRLYTKFDGTIISGGTTNFNVGDVMIWGFDVNEQRDTIELLLQNGTPNASYPLTFAIHRVVINGTGNNPFDPEDCTPT